MNRKAKGSRNEHRSMQLLEATGYRCTRAAASLGAFDIISIGSKDVVLVQVKSRDWPGAEELETLPAFPSPKKRNRTDGAQCQPSPHPPYRGKTAVASIPDPEV